jgi:hypothetical protein
MVEHEHFENETLIWIEKLNAKNRTVFTEQTKVLGQQ